MVHGADGAGLPERIGGYAVERELGAGGMGTVYLARSRGGRAVAVKVARPELASDPHFRERFRAEVAAARSVGGFHTAPVVDADPAAAAPWLATAYIPGPTLSALIAAEGAMDEARLRQLGAALAEALAAIHACGLVHRDLKPGNIIMAADGPRVLDFGIARALESTRLTATGTAFGTPGFLAPEQAQGEEVDGAADVFALGAVLVAAAGGSAFGAGTPMGLMYRSVHEPPDLAAVPAGLRPAVASCLEKEPGRRPTPQALLDLFLPGPAAHPPTVAAPPPPSYAPSAAPQFGPPQFGPPPAGTPPYGATAYGTPPPGPAAYGTPPFGGPYGAAPLHQAPTSPAPLGDAAAGAEPVFAAADPRASVLIDSAGVALGSDDWHLQVSWAEIGTVEYAAEGPKHLRIVVRLRNGAVHHCLLAARRRSRLQEWLEDLPLILECFA
ncbi:serine/threonine-protein kinase [Streptomyces sp. t39]|uniref:serine/threonine-protein kinase n=1 Tax=Streptomyces sp. t39 TaxID=1828156 RepID=UPI0011CD79DF|nr:serine/threonine-protein kinase [Streptomyces sp. t39]TXS51652.1 serine/threonine protein kinase [Streptomyces sp. t39]